jgi:hypothetical protein
MKSIMITVGEDSSFKGKKPIDSRRICFLNNFLINTLAFTKVTLTKEQDFNRRLSERDLSQ